MSWPHSGGSAPARRNVADASKALLQHALLLAFLQTAEAGSNLCAQRQQVYDAPVNLFMPKIRA